MTAGRRGAAEMPKAIRPLVDNWRRKPGVALLGAGPAKTDLLLVDTAFPDIGIALSEDRAHWRRHAPPSNPGEAFRPVAHAVRG